jgi:tRNA-specific 2-thiouridylase
LGQRQLRSLIFPLGNYRKEQVRQKASEFDLAVANKLESQDICFLPDGSYQDFLQGLSGTLKKDIRPGPIFDRQGNLLGRHKGIPFYTIGQRQGLGVAASQPLYVLKMDAKKNAIVVGKKEEALSLEFLVKQVSFTLSPLEKKVALRVKIRYNHQESKACLEPVNRKIRVKFLEPQFAITPGQSAVFYDKNKVVGGGIIDKILA